MVDGSKPTAEMSKRSASTDPQTTEPLSLRPAARLKLLIWEPGEKEPLELNLTVGEWLIGRSKECQVRVNDPCISRMHCRLQMNSIDVVTITDLASRNGTYVGKDRVETSDYQIRINNDQIKCGETWFRVESRN